MDTGVLKPMGAVGGIGGLALGIFLLLFRRVKLPRGTRQHLSLYMWLVWSIAVLGIVCYAIAATRESVKPKPDVPPSWRQDAALLRDGIIAGDSAATIDSRLLISVDANAARYRALTLNDALYLQRMRDDIVATLTSLPRFTDPKEHGRDAELPDALRERMVQFRIEVLQRAGREQSPNHALERTGRASRSS